MESLTMVTDQLSRDIHEFKEDYTRRLTRAISKECAKIRESKVDKYKINYPIKVRDPSPWGCCLVLQGQPNQFHAAPKPAEYYMTSEEQTIRALYNYVNQDPLENRMRYHMDILEIGIRFLDPGYEFGLNKGRYKDDAFRATHLLACYAKADERFPSLAIVVKLWHSRRFFHGWTTAFTGFAFMLMLIQYLQAGCSPPVLPCLHKMHPNVFRTDSDINSLADLEIDFESENKQTVGDLLLGFFRYYGPTLCGGLERDGWKISVREGRPICGQADSPPFERFEIEDPFTLKNVVYAKLLRREYRIPNAFPNIRRVFFQILLHLDRTRDLEELMDLDLREWIWMFVK